MTVVGFYSTDEIAEAKKKFIKCFRLEATFELLIQNRASQIISTLGT
jgi:hypothetical protein